MKSIYLFMIVLCSSMAMVFIQDFMKNFSVLPFIGWIVCIGGAVYFFDRATNK